MTEFSEEFSEEHAENTDVRTHQTPLPLSDCLQKYFNNIVKLSGFHELF